MKRLVCLAAFLYLAQFWPTGQNSAIAAEDIVRLVKDVKPAVVLIQTFDADGQPSSSGSGFFINDKGHIITNHHVIERAYSATVKTSSGREYAVGGVVARDVEADIVKLSVNIQDTNIVPLKLSTAIPSEGEDIIVIGSPLGLEASVSTGIVSAVRDIPAFGKILQITAPVSPGSSGSPVLNTKGEVIGVATFIATEGQNINFAVPSEKILALKETAKLQRQMQTTPLLYAKEYTDAQKLYYSRGIIELWQENWADALTYFQKATAKNPQRTDAWLNIGYCYGNLGRHQDAVESYKQAIRIKPDFAEAHYNLGNAYYELGRYQDAIEAYKQAIRTKLDYAEAYYNLGVSCGELGRYQEAIEAYKQAIRIKPDLAEAHSNLGVAYGELGRYQEAIEAYKQAIRIKPDYTEAHYGLGLSYSELGRHEKAIEAYKQAIRIKTDYTDAYCNLSAAYANLGRYTEAIEPLKQAIRIKPDDAEAHFKLGACYLIIGDKGSALEEYKILKSLDVELANQLFNMIYE